MPRIMVSLRVLLLILLASPSLATIGGEEVGEILYEKQPNGTITVNKFEDVSPIMNVAPILGDFNPSPRLAECFRLGNGNFPVLGNCSRYLQCELQDPKDPALGYIRRIVECPIGLWFREDLLDCGVRHESECPYGRLVQNPPFGSMSPAPAVVAFSLAAPSNSQNCTRDGEFPTPGCRGFFSCRATANNTFDRYTYSCNSNERFDGHICAPQETVRCEVPEEGTSCIRPCVHGDNRICRYNFVLEEFASMSIYCKKCPFVMSDCDLPGCVTAGGVRKTLVTLNRKVPGPVVQACKGDILEIELQNRMSADSTTIHWHGLHQRLTPHMDGVPYITQCPIQPGNTFRYRMEADIAGTHMYHAHIGHQESDGMFGAMIIREPRDAEFDVGLRYDEDVPEHHVLVWHWFSRPAETESADTRLQSLRREGFGYLINGKGNVQKIFNPDTGNPIQLPLETYHVKTGLKYRFRAIFNSALNCPIQLSIDGHLLDILATDGRPIKKQKTFAESVFLSAGERVDFVPHPHWSVKPTNMSFYLRVRGLNDCDDRKNGAFQSAVLHYDGSSAAPSGASPSYTNAIRSGVAFNINSDMLNQNNYYIQARSLMTAKDANPLIDPRISGTPDRIFYMQISFERYTAAEGISSVHPQINKITWGSPASPPLTQPESVTNNTLCRPEAPRNCQNGHCRCPQVLEMNNNELVEIVIIDERSTGLGHPFHMHGFAFRVVAMKEGTEPTTVAKVKSDNENGLISKVFDGPLKDTVIVPGQGYAVIRFVANNPGYWFFHCHISEHMAQGMALVLKVGQHWEMVKPPSNFPRCGNFF